MRKLTLLALCIASPAAFADGASTYAAMCSSCHGATGGGDGVAAVALTPKPANFQDAAFWSTRDDATVARVIKEGGAAVGRSPLMAPFGAAMSDAQITEMVAYLKTFKK